MANGAAHINWRREYEGGVWSDERYVEADSLSAALQAVLDHEDRADAEEAQEDAP